MLRPDVQLEVMVTFVIVSWFITEVRDEINLLMNIYLLPIVTKCQQDIPVKIMAKL